MSTIFFKENLSCTVQVLCLCFCNPSEVVREKMSAPRNVLFSLYYVLYQAVIWAMMMMLLAVGILILKGDPGGGDDDDDGDVGGGEGYPTNVRMEIK